jgi:hypothetical protein
MYSEISSLLLVWGRAGASVFFLTGIRQLSCQIDHLSSSFSLPGVSYLKFCTLKFNTQLELERGSTGSHSVEKSLRKRLWACRKTRLYEWKKEWMSEWTDVSVTRTNAVCNANHGNHAVQSVVRCCPEFTLGLRVHIPFAYWLLSVSCVLYGLPLSDPEKLLSVVF